MEMRTILANVFHRFNLELSEPYMDENVQKNGGLENFAATMGPMDLTPEGTSNDLLFLFIHNKLLLLYIVFSIG